MGDRPMVARALLSAYTGADYLASSTRRFKPPLEVSDESRISRREVVRRIPTRWRAEDRTFLLRYRTRATLRGKSDRRFWDWTEDRKERPAALHRTFSPGIRPDNTQKREVRPLCSFLIHASWIRKPPLTTAMLRAYTAGAAGGRTRPCFPTLWQRSR
ncbi:hypothetical protein BJX62DRAFT_219512 [Aspergillus germanicus]